MDDCVLLKPNLSFKEDIEAYRREMLESNSSMDGTGPLRRMANVEEWLEFNKLCEGKASVPANWVTAEQYVFVRQEDQRIVGMIQLRHYFNDFLEKYGGHVGYSVRPTERRKGYATRMLQACLAILREYGFEKVLVTCTQDNEGSKRTILANGGVYEGTVYYELDGVTLERYWITLR